MSRQVGEPSDYRVNVTPREKNKTKLGAPHPPPDVNDINLSFECIKTFKRINSMKYEICHIVGIEIYLNDKKVGKISIKKEKKSF